MKFDDRLLATNKRTIDSSKNRSRRRRLNPKRRSVALNKVSRSK